MTRFTFIHAADLHLGSPLSGLALKDPAIARRFAEAGRRAFEELVSHAITEGVAFMVIAGDIYDGDWADHTIGLFFAQQVARLDRAGIGVFLVKGNHDAESVVTRSLGLPGSVVEFSSRRAETYPVAGHRVVLHGRSFPNRAVDENYALTYPAAVPGHFNIGVLHTSCAGYAAHETYAPCSIADLAGRGYDYWALGHVHEHATLSRDPWIVFSGNLQGRSVRECGPKGAVAVEVEDGRVQAMRRLIVDQARFHLLSVDVSDARTVSEATTAAEAAFRPLAGEAAGRLLAVRVRLHGTTPLHERFAADRRGIAAEVQAAAQRVHEDIWIERLSLATSSPAAAAPSARREDAPAIDPAALLASVTRDPEFRARAAAAIAEVTGKMPGGLAEDSGLAAEFDALCAEAEALVLGRLSTSND